MNAYTRRSFLGKTAVAIGSFAALRTNNRWVIAIAGVFLLGALRPSAGRRRLGAKSLLHQIENTGDTDLVFLEMFKADRFQDLSFSV